MALFDFIFFLRGELYVYSTSTVAPALRTMTLCSYPSDASLSCCITYRTASYCSLALPGTASDTHRPPDPAARHQKHPDRMHVPNPTPCSPLHETIKYLAPPHTTQPSMPAVRGLDRLMLRSLGFRCDKPATPYWPAGQAALSAAPRSLFPLAALGRAEIMLARAIGRLPDLLARNRGKRGGGGGGGNGGDLRVQIARWDWAGCE